MSHIENLKQYLLETLPFASFASGGDFILAKCVFCNDGKNYDSKHMYVCVKDNEDLPWCYCHICHNTAKLTSEILRTYFGVYDVSLLTTNNAYFSKVYKSTKYKTKMAHINNAYRLKIDNITEDDLTYKKLKYINNRIGCNLTYEDTKRFKIILNISDLFRDNNITKYTRDPRIIKELDLSFIGFLSKDNAFINMRNLNINKYKGNKQLDKRYINYNIFDKDDNTSRFYAISNDLNLQDKVEIHLAEGVFDILSIFMNIHGGTPYYNSAFIAVNGSGFMNVVKHLINGMGIVYADIHIYKDNDMKDYKIQQICQWLSPFCMNIYLHYNSFKDEKDFGVPKDRITMISKKLL